MSWKDKRLTDEELESMLSKPYPNADGEPVKPPEGLLQGILDDIPEDLGSEDLGSDDLGSDDPEPLYEIPEPANDPGPRYGLWALAATVILAVGLGALVFRGLDTEPLAGQAESETAATAPSDVRSEAPKSRPETQASRNPDDVVLPGEDRDALRRQPMAEADEVVVEAPAAQEERARRDPWARPKARKMPIPDPTPSEPASKPKDSIEVTAESPVVQEQLFGFPDAPPPAPAPSGPVEGYTYTEEIQAAPAEAPRLKKVAPSKMAAGVTAPSPVNERAFADNYFDAEAANPFIDTEDDALSTFGLDVDTGSYSLVREYLRRGHLPPKEAVRVEEMVNYFHYRDAPPEDGEGDFALRAEGAPSIYGEGERYYLLRVGVKGREISTEDRAPALLTFVIDVSGSMNRENRLGLVKQSLGLLLDQLRPTDRLALVVYGSRGRVLLEPTSDHGAIRRAIAGLRPEGSTNAGEGLELAYALAARSRRDGEINRVILCSDGVANVGNTSAESILETVKRHADQGVELTTVGFGMGNYNDVLMERLADRGNGRYAYVDTLEEARRIFVENLTGTLQTIAAEARAQVDFNPQVVSRYRLLGYENRAIADHRFRDDTVDAGEIGAGHTVTVLYELKTHEPLRKRDRLATVHLRYASIEQGKMVEQSLDVRGRQIASTWDDAPRSLRLASLVGELAEILRGTYWAREADARDVFIRLQKVAADYPGDTDIAELAVLAGKVSELRARE